MLISFAWPLEGSPNSPLLQKKPLTVFQNITEENLSIVTWIQNKQSPKQESSLVHTEICMWTKCILLPLL